MCSAHTQKYCKVIRKYNENTIRAHKPDQIIDHAMDASEAERKLRESERASRPSNQARNEEVFSKEARGIIDPRSISFRAVKAVYEGVLSGELAAKTELFVAVKDLSEKIKKGATIEAFKVNENGSIEGGAYYADRKVNFVPGKDAVRKLRSDWATEDIAQYVVPQIITDDRQIYLHHLDDVDVGGEFQGVFVSQARKTRFGDLVAALESHFGDKAGSNFVWLDIFSANQPVLTRPDLDTPLETIKAREEFMTHGLHRAISKFDKLVVFFDHWDEPAPLQRAWCVWEVLGAVKSERSLQIAITPGEEDRFMEQLLAASDEIAKIVAQNYDMRKAECFKREDLTMIQQAVEDIDGGFATLNTVVNGRVREWHRQMARVAVNEARVQKGDNIGLARVMFGAGSLLFAQGLYEDAMQDYKEALHIYKHESGGHNLSIANILHSIGSVYRIQGHYEKALREYEEALLIRKKSLNDRHPDVAETLHNIAIVYRKQDHEKEALKFYREALSIREEALGDRHPDVAVTLNSIARVYHNQGRYEDALKSYWEALAMKKAAFGDRHSAIADTLNNIGSVFYAQGLFDDALKYYKETLSIYKEALGGMHLDYASTLFNIGSAYYDRGDKSAALPYFKDADLYFSKIIGPDHEYTTSVKECIRKCGAS